MKRKAREVRTKKESDGGKETNTKKFRKFKESKRSVIIAKYA